ncbi:MAG: DNA mismatch repair protein MutL [Elusimicrobia bacterium ADurb.Bin231]|nr:MAG: DNA mismatch repair protein MutL [Elusimicrobia bacterium ADurb.Bin231]
MGKINILPVHIINKIAAGEVVERPASVVKELLENSLDAGSSTVKVDIINSGKALISVADNGCGMSVDDAIKSVERHSTSKITDISDLEKINTLGFRGEALPSIASVSIMKITTKSSDAETGLTLSITEGKVVSQKSAAVSNGTIIRIEDLFYNVPARLKFLKSDITEKSKIISLLTEYALANCGVALQLYSDGDEVFSYQKTANIKTRIAQIFGEKYLKDLIATETEHGELTLQAFLTKPGCVFAGRNRMFAFVNNRPVNSRILISAVKNGYGEFLKAKENPGFILFITIDPAAIDVNVHPTKREIRFREEDAIYSLVRQTVRSALLNKESIPNIIGENSRPAENKPYESTYISAPGKVESPACESYKSAEFTDKMIFSPRLIGSVFDLYIIAEYDGELLIIDQHAAQEKILFERFMKELSSGNITVQRLLIPVNLELAPKEMLIVKTLLPELAATGFELEEFGRNSFIVKSLPDFITGMSVINIVSELISAKKAGNLGDSSDVIREKIISTSCRTAVKAGDKLSASELNRLIADLFACENPFVCPHGRPTTIRLSKDELDKKFLRK